MRAEDLPYGPGNPDYEYDRWRIERDEDAEREAQKDTRITEEKKS